MSASRTQAGSGRIPPKTLQYFRNRLRSQLFDLVLAEYEKQAQQGFTQRELAHRISRGSDQISRWFSAPGNWTLDTVSDLLLGISEAEPVVGLRKLNRLDKNIE